MIWSPPLTAFRLGLAFIGILLALAGIALDNRWVIWGAILALAASFVTRLIQRRCAGRPSEPA